MSDIQNFFSSSKLILSVDKDFDYINIIKDLFPGCKIFLCGVHIYHYDKDKVPSSKNRDSTGVEKRGILVQFRRVRDAPSE